jgi:epoxyqueuosine reductase
VIGDSVDRCGEGDCRRSLSVEVRDVVPATAEVQEQALRLKRAARARGFQLAGIAPAEPLERELRRLTDWIAAGFHGAMEWIAKEPERRLDPRQTMPEARCVLMLGMSYHQQDGAGPGDRDAPRPAAPRNVVDLNLTGDNVAGGTVDDDNVVAGEVLPSTPGGRGRIARYARGRDYHDLIGERLALLAADAAAIAGRDLAWRPFVDAGPLMERAFAERAGLGFVGKNTCLIHPGGGSWYFLAGLALDLPLPADDPIDGTCGRCTRCLDACPTAAFEAAGRLDARRCISYLTIEQRDAIGDDSLAARLDGWAFGCDVCQDVCPYNKSPEPCAEPEFDGPATLDLRALLAIRTNADCNARFRGSPLQRARRRGLQRTAAHLLVNELLARGNLSAGDRSRLAADLRADLVALVSDERENPTLIPSLREAIARLDAAFRPHQPPHVADPSG